MRSSLPAPALAPRPSITKWVALAAVIAALFAAGEQAGAAVPRFAAWIDSLGALGPVVFIVGYALAVVAFVPASLLTLAAGAIFGLTAGVVYVFVAASLGAALTFLISRYLARGAIEHWIEGDARFAAVDRAVAVEGRKIAFLLRLSPAIPFTLLNYALGLTRVRFSDFLLASFGMLPATFLFVYYGKLAGEVAALASGTAREKGAGDYALLLIGLLATVAVTAVITRAARKALREATAQTGDDDARTAGAAVSSHDEFTSGTVAPLDQYNQELLNNVRPAGWKNPQPTSRYNLVVIGAGAGGLITAAAGAGLGGKVALIERDLMGGDCLNVGCVPSKALIRSARRIFEARELFGSEAFSRERLDREFAAAVEGMRRIRADISRDDSARRYRDELGVDVFQGNARFTGTTTVDVNGQTLRFKKAVIATGARAVVPDVPGLREAGYLTNQNVFNLTQRPRRLAVLGGGPIGCELAQAMRRFGCEVTIFDRSEHLLTREDADAAAIVQARFTREGISLVLGASVESVVLGSAGKTIRYRAGTAVGEVTVDEILISAGRRPDFHGLDLESARVAYDDSGIEVDDTLRSSNPGIYAVGDCCMSRQFTHAADAAAKIVVQNALFLGRKKLSALTIPWCTYTDPEVAHVGLSESEAHERGIAVDTFKISLEKVNRAVCDGEADGFVKVHTKKGSDQIVGATIVAAHAGDMISEITLAMTNAVGLSRIAAVIHPYPTQAEGVKAVANMYMRTRLTPTAKKVLAGWLRLTR